MTQFVNIVELPPNALVIEAADRNQNGTYEIDPGFIHIFPFEILADGQLRMPIRHLNTSNRMHQTYTIRAWISDQPNGSELFFRYHPGTGGTSHLFYDESIVPVPEPKKHEPMRNQFSGITFVPQDNLIPLSPGIYYYNIINMVLKTNAYELFFIAETIVPPIVPPIVPNITVSDVNMGEGGGNASFTINLSEITTTTVTVDYATADGTATTAGLDYTDTSGTANFAPGDIMKIINVPVNDDPTPEIDEMFTLNLSNADNGVITDTTGTATIVDNDDITVPVTAGIIWHMDMQQPSTITLNGSTVSQVTDYSGNGVTLSQASAPNQPTYNATGINGKPAMYFNLDHWMDNNVSTFPSGNADRTIFITYKPEDYGILYGYGTFTTNAMFTLANTGSSPTLKTFVWGFSNDHTGSTNQVAGTIYNLTTRLESSWLTTRINNIVDLDKGASFGNNLANGRVGAPLNLSYWPDSSFYNKGYIGEIIVYDRALTDIELTDVNTYLSNRW